VSAHEIIAFARDRLAHFKCPDTVEFGPLPKTSTGKVQKYVLREKEWAGHETRIGAT
jgi:fatty-acyl-CoA synthase